MKRFFIKLVITGLAFGGGHHAIAQDLADINLKQPVRFSGNLNVQLERYTATGIQNRRQPFSWLIAGNPSVNILGVELPFSFLFSNFENRYYQPFNQFGVSPHYKWATLHLGYRNIQFNPFTLGGYRMLGAGIELNPRGFRFGFMYGRLNRSTALDSAQNANPLAYREQLSYTRMAYAVKVGVGNDKSYFDVSYLKGWDQRGSLAAKYRDSLPAQENAVPGLSWQATVFKKLVWKTDVGFSVYTLDVTSPSVADSSAPEIVKNGAAVLKLKTSTQYLIAGETRLGWRGRILGGDVIYRRVDPDYKSMGAYFFQTDIEQYSVAPYLRLDSGKILVNGSAGIQKDNLYGLKSATAQRFIGNVNVNWNPSQRFGVNANYSNFGITQNPTITAPGVELFKQVSTNVTLTPYVNLTNEVTSKNIQLVASYLLLNSPSATILASPNQHTFVGSLIYAHTWLSKGYSGNISLNYNNTVIAAQGAIGSYGLGLGTSIPLFGNRTSVNVNGGYNSNFYNSAANGYTVTADAGCAYPFAKQHSVQLVVSYLNNSSKDQTVVQSFSEYIFRVVYGFTLK